MPALATFPFCCSTTGRVAALVHFICYEDIINTILILFAWVALQGVAYGAAHQDATQGGGRHETSATSLYLGSQSP